MVISLDPTDKFRQAWRCFYVDSNGFINLEKRKKLMEDIGQTESSV